MNRQPYTTDINDAECRHLQPYMPSPKAGGQRQRHSIRELLNAIFYILWSGCAWRLMPHDLPPWKTVYHYFRLWSPQGLWDKLQATLHAAARIKVGRHPQPSAAIMHSQ